MPVTIFYHCTDVQRVRSLTFFYQPSLADKKYSYTCQPSLAD